MKKSKIFTGICAGVLALSSALTVSAADYVEFSHSPEFKVDFENPNYKAGESIEIMSHNDTRKYRYYDMDIYNPGTYTPAEGASFEIVDAGANRGNALKVNMENAASDKTLALQTIRNNSGIYVNDKVTVKLDMMIPSELDDENESIEIQAISTNNKERRDSICKIGKGGNIDYTPGEWFTVTRNYYIDGVNDVASETIITTKSGSTVTEERNKDRLYVDGGTVTQFFQALSTSVLSNIRITHENNQNHSYFIDNISVSYPISDSSLMKCGNFKENGSWLNYQDTVKGASYAFGVDGKDYTVAKLEYPEGEAYGPTFQTRDFFYKGRFLDDYVEFDAEYYAPQALDNEHIFVQLYSQIKNTTYGDGSGNNRIFTPWEICNGKIQPYSSYVTSYGLKGNSVDVPVNEWFTLRTKIHRRETGDEASPYEMSFSVDLIMQKSGAVTEIIPKTVVTWNSSNYVGRGVLTIRELISSDDNTASFGPVYNGKKSLMKSPAYEIGDIAFTDNEDFEIDYIDGIEGINATVSAVDYVSSDKNVMLWCAVYDENDVLIDVKIKACKLPQGTPDIISLDDYFEIPDDASYFKAGLIDDNMTPLAFGYLE